MQEARRVSDVHHQIILLACNGDVLHYFVAHGEPITTIAFSRLINGRRFMASSGNDYDVNIWDPNVRKLSLTSRAGHSAYLTCVDVHPSGKYAVTGSLDKHLMSWDLETGVRLFSSESQHTDEIWCVSFGRNGELLASGGNDGVVILWMPIQNSLGEFGLCERLDGHGELRFLSFSLQSDKLVTGDAEGRLWVWTIGESLNCKFEFDLYHDQFGDSSFHNRALFDDSGKRILSETTGCDYDNYACIIWNVESRNPLKKFTKSEYFEELPYPNDEALPFISLSRILMLSLDGLESPRKVHKAREDIIAFRLEGACGEWSVSDAIQCMVESNSVSVTTPGAVLATRSRFWLSVWRLR